MRQGPNPKRSRGRNNNNNNNGGGGGGGGRRPNLPLRMQTFDSNGPDVRIRGTAFQVHEKYLQLARDASSSGDRIIAESYLQHAEHYYRIIAVAQEQQAQQQGGDPNRRYPQQGGYGQDFRQDGEGNAEGGDEFGGEEGEGQAPRGDNGYRQDGRQDGRQENQSRQDGNYRERGPNDRSQGEYGQGDRGQGDRAQGDRAQTDRNGAEVGFRHNGENGGERRPVEGDGYRQDGRQDRNQNHRQPRDNFGQDGEGAGNDRSQRPPSEERPRRQFDDTGAQPQPSQQPRRPVQYGDRPERAPRDNGRNGGSQPEAVSAPVEIQLPLSQPAVYGKPVDETPSVSSAPAGDDAPPAAPRRGRPRRVKVEDSEPVAEG
jgi:hypothetical protein